jgi:hypothetical protein
MKTKLNVITLVLLTVVLISACAPVTAAQPTVTTPVPPVQQNSPPTQPPTAILQPTSTPATADSQQANRAATQQAAMRNMDQKVEATAAAVATGPNHFSGAWAGTMKFSDDPNHTEDIQIVIPQGCQLGKTCGYLDNTTVQCKWEITLNSIKSETLEYTFSKLLSGDCPTGSSGTLTMQPDGTLLREHKTPDFTASGSLTRQK